MSLKKATAAESKAIEQRRVCSNSFGGIVELLFYDRKDLSKGKLFEWVYQEKRLQDLLDKLDEIEGEWRSQKDLTDKEDIPIKVCDYEKNEFEIIQRIPDEGDGFISCEDGCVVLKLVNNGKETVYERFDNPDDFSKFTGELHAFLIRARSCVERALAS